MDPVGSWSAYAASYRLTNGGGFQSGGGASSSVDQEIVGGGAAGGQLLLQAAPTTSPFNPTGFLSPPPVAYDPVFTPLFHQKAHYSPLNVQHRPLKQPSDSEITPRDNYNQIAASCTSFFEQGTNSSTIAWSQGNAQLPSPFGILPHESIIPDSPGATSVTSKPYENFNTPFPNAQTLNQLTDYKAHSFIESKKRPPSPPLRPVTTAAAPNFFQHNFSHTESDINFKQQVDYTAKTYQNGTLPQTCIVTSPSIMGSKEYRIPHPPRTQFPSPQRPEKTRTLTPPAIKPLNCVPSKIQPKVFDNSERTPELESQSSPISFAMMDAQRNYQNLKLRNTQFQQMNQQNYRYSNVSSSESDYQRSKSSDNFSSNASTNSGNCNVTVPRRSSPFQAHSSPSGQHSVSPVYPMYNSPMPAISSSPPVQHETCYTKQNTELTPPLDVTMPRTSVAYPSVITRTDKNYNDNRFDRQDFSKQQWDDRQRKFTAYSENPQNIQQRTERQPYFESNHQVALQDLSSCRGDPMSLVKTLQQQQPESKVTEDKFKNRRKSTEKPPDSDYVGRVPPPAHHNANQPNQNGYYDFERWNLPPPPAKMFPTSPAAFGTQTGLTGNFVPNHQHQSLMVPHPGPPLPYFPAFPLPPSQPAEPSPNETTETITPKETQPKVIVPNIEEELGFLVDDVPSSEEVKLLPRKPLAPNPNSGFMSSYEKFLQGERDPSPPPNPRNVKKMAWSAPKIYLNPEPAKDPANVNEGSFPMPEEFPSDPQDDPRYFPLPKSSENRHFDTSDSDFSDDGFIFGTRKEKKPDPKPDETEKPVEKSVSLKPVKLKKKPKQKPRTKQVKEDHSEISTSRRETTRRKAKEKKLFPVVPSAEVEEPIADNDSDVDPVWTPQIDSPPEKETESRKRKGKRNSSTKKKHKCSKTVGSDIKKTKKDTCNKICSKKIKKKKTQPPSVHVQEQPAVTEPKKPAVKSEAQFPFSVGEFVVLKSDLYLYNPPIWRVKEKAILQKFQHFVRDGITLYNNLPTYTGWSPESKNVYMAVPVKIISQCKPETVVQPLRYQIHEPLLENMKIIQECTKETNKYQDNFEVYIQTLFSQALDSNFLLEIFIEKDEYFLSNVRAIDGVTGNYKKKLIDVLGWDKLGESLLRYPNYRKTPGGVGRTCTCHSGTPAAVLLELSGCSYHPVTLQIINDKAGPSLELFFCAKCMEWAELLHKLCHQKRTLFAHCEERVQHKRIMDPKKDTTAVLNELLADEVWLNQLFKEVRSTWGLVGVVIKEMEKTSFS